MKLVYVTISILILVSGCKQTGASNVYEVKKIIDGDSIYLSNGKIVDLIGINSPEVESNEDFGVFKKETVFTEEKVIEFSKFAKILLEEIIQLHKSKVLLIFDKEKTNQEGHVWAYAYIDLEFPSSKKFSNNSPFLKDELIVHDGTYWIMLNATLLESGFAIPDRVSPNTKFSELFQKIYIESGKEKLLNTFNNRVSNE